MVSANKHESIIIQVRIRCVDKSIMKVCVFIRVDSASSEAFLTYTEGGKLIMPGIGLKQVILRTRPISAAESAVKGFNRCVRQDSPHTITWTGQPESRFTFDHVAGEHITQVTKHGGPQICWRLRIDWKNVPRSSLCCECEFEHLCT